MAKAHKKAKLDETFEKNAAFELEDGVLVYVKTLNEEEHKRKLEEDAMMEIDRELVQEAIVNESIQAQSAQEMKNAQMEELN